MLKTLLFVPVALLLFTTCKKEEEQQPSASFSFDKAEYLEGETIQLHDNSQNAASQRWTMPDGQTATGAHASFVVPSVGVDRTLQFKLEVFSESRNKSDMAVKNVSVKVPTGQMILYNNYFITAQTVTVFITPGEQKTIVMPSMQSGQPNCGDAGHHTFNLKAGNYSVQVYYSLGTVLWSGQVNITKDNCSRIRVM